MEFYIFLEKILKKSSFHCPIVGICKYILYSRYTSIVFSLSIWPFFMPSGGPMSIMAFIVIYVYMQCIFQVISHKAVI